MSQTVENNLHTGMLGNACGYCINLAFPRMGLQAGGVELYLLGALGLLHLVYPVICVQTTHARVLLKNFTSRTVKNQTDCYCAM